MLLRLGAILACLTCLLLPDQASGQRRAVTIGLVSDGPYQRHGYFTDFLESEILSLLSGEFDVRMPADVHLEGDWTLAGIQAALDRLLVDRSVDLIVTLGPISSHVAAQRQDLSKPVVTPLILDAALQGLDIDEGGGSGIDNLTYIALPQTNDIQAFQEIVPFERLAVLINGPQVEAIPELAERLRAAGEAIDLDAVIIAVGLTVESTLAALDDETVDAVYVLPQLQLSDADWSGLVQGLIDRQLPSFSWFGYHEVAEGILAGQRPERFVQRVARRVALNIQRILLGEDPSTVQVGFAAQRRLAINMATARAIGIYPPWKVMTEAELFADEQHLAEREWTLESAVQEVVRVNLDLAAADRAVAAGSENIGIAKSDLYPQIDIGADWSLVDAERAESSFGLRPETMLTGTATLTQLIYGEPAWANVSVQKSVQEARAQGRETLWLDVAFDAAVAYLDVLKSKTVEGIERQNLNVTRENLEFAELRRSIGTASAGEVYRWENQIANNRQAVINANTVRNLVEIELNRLLDRPLEERFATAEADLDDPQLLTSEERLVPYIDDLRSFRVFRSFMAQEAVDASPEVKALDALAAAQRRALQSADRSFYLPGLALQSSVEGILSTGGAGSDFQGGLASGDVRWTIGVGIRYPLLTGASRFYVKAQAAEELASIETERQSVAQRVEGRARAALHTMGAARANLDLSRDAAEAARNNFEVVRDSYSRGVASIIDLLDAQNTALVAELRAANAVYNFLTELMRVERAAGRFDFFTSAEERDAFFQRLEAYFQQAGMQQ